MGDGEWRTLAELSRATGIPEASASADLRHLRKSRFGGHTVNKRRRQPEGATWEYQLILSRALLAQPFPSRLLLDRIIEERLTEEEGNCEQGDDRK
jgi:hypothetical protein